MKIFISIALLSFALISSQTNVYAQKGINAHKVVPDDGSQPPSPPTVGQSFIGEWEWVDGDEVFHLTLTRNSSYVFPSYPNDPPVSVIIGHFVYTRNGVIIDRSLSTGPWPFAALGSPSNSRNMRMNFHDHGTKGFGYLTLSFVPNNPNMIDWHLESRETSYRNPADRPTVDFMMPKVMTLTRQ